MRWHMALVVALLVASCSTIQRAELAERARTELLGLSKDNLLACAGVPDKHLATRDREYLTYVVERDDVSGRFCAATFVLKDSRVEAVAYRGQTGGLLTAGEQCGYVVQNCLE